MTQRQRKATAGTTATAAVAVVEPPRPAALPEPASPYPWETYFRLLSPSQQEQLLALSRRQGILFAHQLPGPNGKSVSASDQTSRANLLNQILAGHCSPHPGGRGQGEEGIAAEELSWVDSALDANQRLAVARALTTPDVAVIVGWPGTGKSRVVAELLTQAGMRGDRVLFLAPTAAAIDHVLPQIAQRDALCPLRLLEPREALETLSPGLRSMTLGLRRQAWKDQALELAHKGQVLAESRCQKRRQEESLWPRLQNLVEQTQQLDQQRHDLQQRKSHIADAVAQEIADQGQAPATVPASTFANEVLGHLARHQETGDRLRRAREGAEQAGKSASKTLADLETRLGQLRPLAEAKQKGRWWSWKWWRATFRGKVVEQLADLEQQQREAQNALTAAKAQIEELADQTRHGDQELQANLERVQAAEVQRRLEEIQAQENPLQLALDQLDQQWAEAGRGLESELPPAARTEEALDAARLAWQDQFHHDEETCQFARQWLAFLQQPGDHLEERFHSWINVVAGTIAAFTQDQHFGNSSREEIFDLLVLEEADQITEAEFLKLARRARRWVLIGEPGHPFGCVGQGAGLQDLTAAQRPASRDLGPATFLQKLWHQLHWDPRRLPFAWGRDGDRLCCRLRLVPAEQRRWLETERVADSPDIELRILSLPRLAPTLAEVVFPAATTLAQAKAFIYRELQEVPVQAPGRAATLEEHPDFLRLRLADDSSEPTLTVVLEQGIRERLLADNRDGNGDAAALWTAQLEFDKSAGWTRVRVLAWAGQHLHYRDLGRTAWLPLSYRMEAGLAAWISDVIFGGALASRKAALEPSPNGQAIPVVFVPVPAPRKEDGRSDRRKGSARSPALSREGAGLEQDLAVPRHGDRLPNDLRPHLPSHGVVNYLEAQSLLRKLESLARQNTSLEPIAVIAPSAAQVELLRLLISRSSYLSALPVEIGVPASFRHREFGLVLMSLTRSHNHRAVSFSDAPAQLIQALTRARRQLVIFGDPGTLLRRSLWQGRVEPLDETASAREAQLIGDLVRYLHGQGKQAWAFRMELPG